MTQSILKYAAVAFGVMAFFTITAIPVQALPLSLTASDQGFVTETGGTDKFDGTISPATGNYSVGYELACPAGGLCGGGFIPLQRKNYFVFDSLASVGSPITAATLKLFNPAGGYENGPGDPTETFAIGATDPGLVTGVLSKIADIGTVVGPGDVTAPLIATAVALFAELGESLGPIVGSLPPPGITVIADATVSAADDGTVVDVVFNAEGIAYLNTIAGLGLELVLGGALLTSDPLSGVPQSMFGFSSSLTSPAPELVLELAEITIPAPGGAAMLMLGIFLMGPWRGRTRR
jgi:hypothetical protein